MASSTSSASSSSSSQPISSSASATAWASWARRRTLRSAVNMVHTPPSPPPPTVTARSNMASTRRAPAALSRSTCIWPLGTLPVELFEIIAQKLSREDVMSMRLVSREFESKVSRTLFHTSVVPFNTELYDMIDENTKTATRSSTLLEAVDPGGTDSGLQWVNAKEDREGKVYKGHGLRVFQGFGYHIQRFGMSFEVTEAQLGQPPVKKDLDRIESYHGSYKWPPPHYARFANLAGLENTADETSRMKAAFANLTNVKELALSLDSGLGWLNGPDSSIRSRIFSRQSPVFGRGHSMSDSQLHAASAFWEAIQQSHRRLPGTFATLGRLSRVAPDIWDTLQASSRTLHGENYAEIPIAYRPFSGTLEDIVESANTHDPTANDVARHFEELYNAAGLNDTGVTHSACGNPSELSKEQKEWLLEMEWAQRAFLDSWMLAVVDNASIFGKVKSLNLAKLSSRFLPVIAREHFWVALPCLEDVTLRVSADWRTVDKDDAGIAETTSINPSDAVASFYAVLDERISQQPRIKKLNIGWVGGGEHAEGMFARNDHLLPAPITPAKESVTVNITNGIVFWNVEHLTLSNCWISPPGLEQLIRCHANKNLKKIVLDSVSLTAHPSVPPQVGAANAAVVAANALHQHQAAILQHPFPNAPPGGHTFPNIPNLGIAAGPMGPPNQPPQLMILQQQTMVANAGNVNMNAPFPAAGLNPPSHFTAGHRTGSWPAVVDQISPGLVFNDYLQQPEPWERQFPERLETALETVEFISCGYGRLHAAQAFDQLVIEEPFGQNPNQTAWFRVRHAQLKPMMMETHDRYIGHVVPYIPPREVNALQLAWGLRTGWTADGTEPTYDGFRPGGTGRFSGTVSRGMIIADGASEMGRNDQR